MAIDPSARIHPSALVEEGARIGPGCRIGPFSVIGAEVELERDVEIGPHVVIEGRTRIGAGTTIHAFAALGGPPQHLGYKGEPTELVIGRGNRIREHVSIHRGTAFGGGVTRIGDGCFLMGGSHVAHDVQMGNRVIMAQNAAIAGHAIIEDEVIIGGLAGIHQFVRVGRGAIIAGVAAVVHDVVPYALVSAPRSRIEGLNLVGLKRRGASRAEIRRLRAAFEELFDSGVPLAEAAERLARTAADQPLVQDVVRFVTGPTERHYLTPRSGR